MTVKLNPAEQAELDRLIAEQEADDRRTLDQSKFVVSLDAPLTDEEGSTSLIDQLQRDEIVEGGPVRSHPSRRIRPEQVREWRALRKGGWKYQRIADYAGVQEQTIRNHISRGKTRISDRLWRLEQHLEDARQAYEAGAFLREIAELLYEEVGYGSWEACYQALRKLFQRHDIAIRSKDQSKRNRSGRPAPGAPLKEWQALWRRQNQRAKQRRRARLIRCDTTTREGRPCRRWAVLGGRYCMCHDKRIKQQPKWTREALIAALRSWAEEHGRPPRAKDWCKATEDHPTFKTVIDRFGKWNFALYEAGLRKRKHPKPRPLGRQAKLARGYKECAREGCTKLVPGSWHYCRDRHCQDARPRFGEAATGEAGRLLTELGESPASSTLALSV